MAAAVVVAGVGGAVGGGTFAAAMGVSAAGSLAARAVIRRSRSTSPAPDSCLAIADARYIVKSRRSEIQMPMDGELARLTLNGDRGCFSGERYTDYERDSETAAITSLEARGLHSQIGDP